MVHLSVLSVAFHPIYIRLLLIHYTFAIYIHFYFIFPCIQMRKMRPHLSSCASSVSECIWVLGVSRIQANGDGWRYDAVDQVIVGAQPVLSGCCSRSGCIVGDASGDVENVRMLRGVGCESARVNCRFGS